MGNLLESFPKNMCVRTKYANKALCRFVETVIALESNQSKLSRFQKGPPIEGYDQ